MTRTPLICARCRTTPKPGSGEFWEVHIQAVADPWPPEFPAEDLQFGVRREFAECVRELEDLSPREAMDQVHRRTVIHLCKRCFSKWYEDPAG